MILIPEKLLAFLKENPDTWFPSPMLRDYLGIVPADTSRLYSKLKRLRNANRVLYKKVPYPLKGQNEIRDVWAYKHKPEGDIQ